MPTRHDDLFTATTEVGGAHFSTGEDCNLPDELFGQVPEEPLLYPEFTLCIFHPVRPCSYILRGDIYTIGRDPSSSIQIVNCFVSRRHAYLVRVPTRSNRTGFTYCLIDGDRQGRSSTNGVFVNGKRVATHYLKSGDVIYFGPQIRAYFFEVVPIPHLPNSCDLNFSPAEGSSWVPEEIGGGYNPLTDPELPR